MKLIIPVSVNILFTTLIYLIDRHTSLSKIRPALKQCIIGILFGLMAAFYSEFGVKIDGAIINIRDCAPISAGLVFGAPSGIIAGCVGALYRFLSVYWGAGTYTRIACSVSTFLAGLIAALLRRYMFDNKKPAWSYGFGIAAVCEVIHMLMIFITNHDDPTYAFSFVQECTIPMIIANSFAVGISILIISIISREKSHHTKKEKRISQTFQRWLLVCILTAYVVTGIFTFNLQSIMSKSHAQSIIIQNIMDVNNDITEASDENLLSVTHLVKKEFLKKTVFDTQTLTALAQAQNVDEINIIDKNGTIIGSTLSDFIGYDMYSGSQSAEFTVLLNGQTEYVQSYQPTSFDPTLSRKYAGTVLPDGGFIQVGYDSTHFRQDINNFIIDATKNRHVGTEGFVAICDESFNIISEDEYNGKSLTEIGISINTDSMSEDTIYESNVYDTPYSFAYSFKEGYYIIGAMPVSETMFMRNALTYLSTFMQLIIFGALFVLIYFLIKKIIINNLHKINNTLGQITSGNLNVTVDVRSNEEFSSLSDDINSTVATLKNYIAEAAAKIDKELEYAKTIQLSALPQKFPPYPNQKRFDIYACMTAAKEVGGDFYDFYMLDNHTVAFLVADVSGKGIPAAMFMMTSKTIIKDLAENGIPVNDIFTKANEKLCMNNESGMFVTAWMGIMDLDTGKLQFANAGHNPPVIIRNGKPEYLKTRPGFVLAGMEGIRYRINETTLSPGDRIFLYTDGVTEATDTEQQLYGDERLISYMNTHKADSPKTLLTELKNDIDRFAGNAPQFDDITMLIFDYISENESTGDENDSEDISCK